MNDKVNKIMEIMNTIEYGFKDTNGKNILEVNPKKYDEEFYDFYYLLSPDELLGKKCGVCWDQVELERKLFSDIKVQVKTYFICIYDGDNLPSHTFLTYKDNNKYYWFEHSWNKYCGIHEYDTLESLLLDVKDKFIQSNLEFDSTNTFVYEYQPPKYHTKFLEFYNYIETQKLVKLNKPLYFYHLVSKQANLEKGLMSLQYMYDHQEYELFDKSICKYKQRITNDWGFDKYKNKKNLTREDYLEALNKFRGEEGSNYIYFFKYPPYKELGKKIEELLQYKDVYRININDEEIMKNIKDIFYGYDMSNSDNKVLNRLYYEQVTKKEYFSKYDDSLKMNFSTLNHIGISFKDGFCPIKFLEKVDEKIGVI